MGSVQLYWIILIGTIAMTFYSNCVGESHDTNDDKEKDHLVYLKNILYNFHGLPIKARSINDEISKRSTKETSTTLSTVTQYSAGNARSDEGVRHDNHNNESGHNNSNHDNNSVHLDSDQHKYHSIHVAAWNFEHVQEPFVIAVFILFAGIAKLCFHNAECISSHFPESCLLIILGAFVGAIFHFSVENDARSPNMTSNLFFLFLLPPSILESAYSLHDRTFYDNVGTVLIYAVIGTVFNFFLIGPALYGLINVGAMGSNIHISLIQCLVFSSIIIAVDPVAVLATFQEVGVNNVLYFLVFGESLLNDAVTVVLYNMTNTFNLMPYITIDQVILGIVAFFVVSLGGMAIGLMFGILTAIITKYSQHCRVVEPLAVFTIAYISYLSAEMFHFSGIISIIACGLTQAQYAFHNISRKSYTTVKYFSKMQSSTSECIIFMFLGFELYQEDLLKSANWHAGFIIWALVLCFVSRFIVVFLLTLCINHSSRLRKIDVEEQFIMGYGGLRGAVAFSLADLLDVKYVERKGLFLTTTLVLIFFTVFVQGISIKPLVKFLRVKMQEKQKSTISEEIHRHVTDHVMAGIEEILGERGEHYVREIIEHYNNKYLKNWLQRNPLTTDDQIMKMFQKIALRQHFENLAGSKMIQEKYGNVSTDGDHDVDSEHEEEIEETIKDSETDGIVLPSTTVSSISLPASPSPDLSEQGSDLEFFKGKVEMRRKSMFPMINIAKRQEPRIPENPTPLDIRRMMAPTRRQMQITKLDKNLKTDSSEHDLLHYLREKQNRTRRISRAVPSLFSVPGIMDMNKSPVKCAANATANYRRRLSLAAPEKRPVVSEKHHSEGNIFKGIALTSPVMKRLNLFKARSRSSADEKDEQELSPLNVVTEDNFKFSSVSHGSLEIISEYSDEGNSNGSGSPKKTSSPKPSNPRRSRLKKSRSFDLTKPTKAGAKKSQNMQTQVQFAIDSSETLQATSSIVSHEAETKTASKRKHFKKSHSMMEQDTDISLVEEKESIDETEQALDKLSVEACT
ncbi:hypothetical protein CHS0354_021383 [Potamilus streckersoni]|uniref:Sodium/hydrogen exchanger n=1 Tax=Potamilus streckersoni TaxID=2493646 RepID=A0AAE0S1N2_9BIVA|nr:hypothetical protein CHS0354_021383 [Potamilus streckersoni]